MLFAGVYVCTFQPGNFTGCGSEEVNINAAGLLQNGSGRKLNTKVSAHM